MMYPDFGFGSAMYNPYSLLSAQKSRFPTDSSSFPSSLSTLSPSLASFYQFPTPSMSFASPTAARMPFGYPFPPLETPAKISLDRKTPETLKVPSRKRSPPEGDTPCALDLSVKRHKFEREGAQTSQSHRSSNDHFLSLTKSAYAPLNLKFENKKPGLDNTDIKQKLKLSINSQSKHMDKSIPKCKCGADNPENIMNWSCRKVYEFVSGLEGCSSYAKVCHLDHVLVCSRIYILYYLQISLFSFLSFVLQSRLIRVDMN